MINNQIARKHKVTIDSTNQNENISFSIAVLKNGDKESLELTFITNKEAIYKTSDKKKVLYPPSSISLDLDEDNLLTLTSCLISSMSQAFKKEEIEELGHIIEVNGYVVKMTKNIDSRYKIVFDIYKNQEQIISFPLGRTRICLLLFLIKDTFKKIESPCHFLVENKKYLFKVFKNNKNEFSIDKSVLRNSEIEILRNITYSLIFNFKYESKLANYKKIYRQILVFVNRHKEFVVMMKNIEKNLNSYFTINSQLLAALMLSLPEIDIFKSDEVFSKKNKVFDSKYIIKAGKNFLGFNIEEAKGNSPSKHRGNVILKASDIDNRMFAEINLGKDWIFFLSDLIELYNGVSEIPFFSHQWSFSDHIIRVTHFKNENTLMMIKHKNSENTLNIILEPTSFFELVTKIIELVQNISNFRFSLLNPDNPKENLSLAKIDEKFGTIITTFNGVQFGKPHLSESDKYQIKYSAINRLLFERWLSVHAERVNISSSGVITTVDSEYVLDQNEKNKSTLVALALLSSLSFKGEDDGRQ